MVKLTENLKQYMKEYKYLSEKLMKEPLEDFNHPPFHTVDMTYFQPFDFDDIEFV